MSLKKLFLIVILIFFNSCTSKKDIYYFQDIDASSHQNSFSFLEIQPGDILDIQIKALNPESVQIFQKPSVLIPQQQLQNRVLDGYLVGEAGNIQIPLIGTIDTTDHNTQSLAIAIQEALSFYVKNPSVNVRLLNFRISVLGEVRNPGTYTISEESISLPQALGLAGDLTIFGDRKNLLLIRNKNGKKINKIIDITKSQIIESPFYFLQQNDIIYVRPNNAQVKSSGLVGDSGTVVSILSLAVSLFILITR